MRPQLLIVEMLLADASNRFSSGDFDGASRMIAQAALILDEVVKIPVPIEVAVPVMEVAPAIEVPPVEIPIDEIVPVTAIMPAPAVEQRPRAVSAAA